MACSSCFSCLLELWVLQWRLQEDDISHSEVQPEMSLVHVARNQDTTGQCSLRLEHCNVLFLAASFQALVSIWAMVQWCCKKGVIACHVNWDHTCLHVKAMLWTQACHLFMLSSPIRNSIRLRKSFFCIVTWIWELWCSFSVSEGKRSPRYVLRLGKLQSIWPLHEHSMLSTNTTGMKA